MAYLKLPRSNPEEQGISSSHILDFIEAVEKLSVGNRSKELHSFMLIRHGYVVAEGWWSPYTSERPHMLFSLSKSFTSTAVGMAVNEDFLSLDDRVVSFFTEDLPENPSNHLLDMKVRHLLYMATGHKTDTMGYIRKRTDGNWVRGFFDVPVEYEPGTHFLYNTGATYMLSAILQKRTGQKLIDYLQPRLFKPLEIDDPTWETCPRGINTGGFGLSIKTEDIAKFGQLYLQEGFWNGSQIIPKAWVAEATASHISNGTDPNSEWAQGYGYQFWRCRHNVYRGDGAFGQYCVVMPDQDAVIAVNSGLDDMQAIYDLFWKHLLPGMKSGVLPADPIAHKTLKDKLSSLMLPLTKGNAISKVGAEVSGRSYRLENNPHKFDSVSFDFNQDECLISISSKGDTYRIRCGIGKRTECMAPLLEFVRPAAVCGAWTSDNVFCAELHFIETPFCLILQCSFIGEKLAITAEINVSMEGERTSTFHGERMKHKEGNRV